MADEAGSSSTPALDKLNDYVRRKKQKEKAKIKTMYVKRDVEKAHAQYLRNHKYSHRELETCSGENQTADWTRRESLMDEPDIRRRLTTVEADPYRKPAEHVRNTSDRANVRSAVLLPSSHQQYSCPGSRNMTDEEILVNSLRLIPDILVATYFCPIEQCGAGFSCTKKLKNHLSKFEEHSPCHPYKHIVNLELSSAVKEYRCPTCFSMYKSVSLCMTHMMAQEHNILELYKPVGIAAYACPECFLIYSDAESCRQHIAEANHINYRYRFSDDPSVADPLLLSPAILEQYIGACRESDYHLECLHCGRKLQPEEDSIRCHLKDGHTIMALTEKSLTDVFSEFQRKYTCACCQMLFKELPAGGLEAIHQCNNKYTGMIVENNCSSSTEFMLRLALHRPASTKLEFPSCSATTSGSSTKRSKGHDLKKKNFTQEVPKISVKRELSITGNCYPTVKSLRTSSVADDDGQLLRDSCDNKNDLNTSTKKFSTSRQWDSPRKRKLGGKDKEELTETKIVKKVKYLNDVLPYVANEDLISSCSEVSIIPKCETFTEDDNNCYSSSSSLSPQQKEEISTKSSKATTEVIDDIVSDVVDTSSTDIKNNNCKITHEKRKLSSISEHVNLANMERMKHILFLDLDDSPGFFQMLSHPLPGNIFVWAFCSIKWEEPTGCQSYEEAVSSCSFHLQRETKRDSVHIKMALTIGRMDERLQKSTTFSIMSDDKEFCEQLELSDRCTVFINLRDHNSDDLYDMLYSMSGR